MRQYGTPALLFAAAAVVLGVLCSRIADWAAMTDELLYERLSLVDGDAVEEVTARRDLSRRSAPASSTTGSR